MSTILVVEDEEILRDEIAALLIEKGHRVLTACDGNEGFTMVAQNAVQLVISDLRLPKLSGIDLLRNCRINEYDTPFIIMTAFGSVETAVEAMRAGAADYIMKPLSFDELLSKTARVLESFELRAENRMLRRDLDRKLGPLEMVGASPILEKIRELIRKVGPTRSSVLITGESGTGKELIARAIHSLGATKSEPFVPVNCAAIPEQLLESELFGHQRGSFTGAVSDSEGLFRSARKGTLFLDEIGELPLSLQAKLLRVLEDKMVHPVGSSKFFPFEGRIVAATNRDLKQDSQDKKFREDLYFRLAVVEIDAPPLRSRRGDIPLLVNYFIKKLNRDLNRNFTGVDPAAMQTLTAAPWRGNIRELQNMIERAMILGTEPLLTTDDVASRESQSFGAAIDSKNLKEAVSAFEQAHVRRILAACNQDKKQAAHDLEISLSSLYRLLGSGEPAE
ncbi:MAG: sigma-54 dependent transcriptional regulator [Planctomycetota bacterium]